MRSPSNCQSPEKKYRASGTELKMYGQDSQITEPTCLDSWISRRNCSRPQNWKNSSRPMEKKERCLWRPSTTSGRKSTTTRLPSHSTFLNTWSPSVSRQATNRKWDWSKPKRRKYPSTIRRSRRCWGMSIWTRRILRPQTWAGWSWFLLVRDGSCFTVSSWKSGTGSWSRKVFSMRDHYLNSSIAILFINIMKSDHYRLLSNQRY